MQFFRTEVVTTWPSQSTSLHPKMQNLHQNIEKSSTGRSLQPFWQQYMLILFGQRGTLSRRQVQLKCGTFIFVIFRALVEGTLDSTTCTGYGFWMILFIFINFGVAYKFVLKKYCIPPIERYVWKPCAALFKKVP